MPGTHRQASGTSVCDAVTSQSVCTHLAADSKVKIRERLPFSAAVFLHPASDARVMRSPGVDSCTAGSEIMELQEHVSAF